MVIGLHLVIRLTFDAFILSIVIVHSIAELERVNGGLVSVIVHGAKCSVAGRVKDLEIGCRCDLFRGGVLFVSEY
jgi:hypothetical protein